MAQPSVWIGNPQSHRIVLAANAVRKFRSLSLSSWDLELAAAGGLWLAAGTAAAAAAGAAAALAAGAAATLAAAVAATKLELELAPPPEPTAWRVAAVCVSRARVCARLRTA